ncbi:hypothetical protein SODALDRAFT_364228 [Sodiomyces alkalinus F11]|uniref:Uncharacterized protein n=1 Tax=Sodiomyces alkalinus (strain CBS 110278 / VKM F-3762 / F11) TaxID=1314773 RepID=A0A3N2PJW0_SODAK|nr:hypothetical protein SODALDRAFT_364228 [Sodiomyces alkalinus F11]ROT34720.1 hypothetical protein SODALDRAFT_364228 [Sodiomyces alkalinus F11]
MHYKRDHQTSTRTVVNGILDSNFVLRNSLGANTEETQCTDTHPWFSVCLLAGILCGLTYISAGLQDREASPSVPIWGLA